ncbi:hypothetical protein L914_01729, partial [Phytophthora nicotianae]
MRPQKNGAGVDHKNVINYDDVNEFFWRNSCLHFDDFNVAEAVNARGYKTFKEHSGVLPPLFLPFRHAAHTGGHHIRDDHQPTAPTWTTPTGSSSSRTFS